MGTTKQGRGASLIYSVEQWANDTYRAGIYVKVWLVIVYCPEAG